MKLFSFILCAALIFSGCSSESEEIPGSLQEVKFKVSAPLSVKEEPISRGSSKDLASTLDKIYYTIWDTNQDGALVKGGEQLSTDPNFGDISVKLNAGTYKAYFLGISKNGEGTIDYSHAHIKSSSFHTFNKEFFRNLLEELIVSGKSSARSIVLKRAVGLVVFNITDPVPADIKFVKVNFKTSVVGTGPHGGLMTGNPGNVYNKAFPIVETRLSDLSVYLLPQTIDLITITAYDQANEPIVTKKITNLAIEANKKYTVSGTLFEGVGKNDFTISIDEAWDQEVNVPL